MPTNTSAASSSATLVVVGVNEYVMPEEQPVALCSLDERATEAQLEKLSVLKRHRDQSQVTAVLDRLHGAARGTTNLVPIIIEAVECGRPSERSRTPCGMSSGSTVRR